MTNKYIKKLIPEFHEIVKLKKEHPGLIQVEQINEIQTQDGNYPVYSVKIGSADKSAPTLGLFGGVHGIERIGSQVLISYLSTLSQRLKWDKDILKQLENRRIVCLPIVNPWGIAHFKRSNANGVDLMRNAPVDSDNATFFIGGHRYSNKLSWYRGQEGVLEKENEILINFVKEEMFPSSCSIALDFHSGFGTKDQIWYPYARSKNPFPYLKNFKQLANLFEETYPHHIYKIEAQTLNYMTHGDIWDYSLDLHQESGARSTFIPLTLELGSWNWIKKNPIQLFSRFGQHNPVKSHRYSRTMRRHLYLIDFLIRAIANNEKWDY